MALFSRILLATTATLVATVLFFTIIGVFGLTASILALLVTIAGVLVAWLRLSSAADIGNREARP